MGTQANNWAWPDAQTGLGTRTAGASAAFAATMGAEALPDQRFVGAFDHWDSGYGGREEDAPGAVEAPRMQKLFEHWNSMSRRANHEPQLDLLDSNTSRVFQHWHSTEKMADCSSESKQPNGRFDGAITPRCTSEPASVRMALDISKISAFTGSLVTSGADNLGWRLYKGDKEPYLDQRVDPHDPGKGGWWKKVKATWLDKLKWLGLSAAARTALFLGFPPGSENVKILPQMRRMARHWLANTGERLYIDMEQFLRASPDDLEACNNALESVVQFAEDNIEPGSGSRHIVSDWRAIPTSRLKQHPDWWWAIGGHCGYGEAWITRRGEEFVMKFTWHLTDTQTVKNKLSDDTLLWAETRGFASGFLVEGEFTRTYTWRKGNFHATCNPHYR